MFLNDNILDIDGIKPDGISSPTFAVDDFSGLFLNPTVFISKIQDLHK